MSNTSKRRRSHSSRLLLAKDPAPRCQCKHPYDPNGQCTQDATARVTVVCQVEDCDCAATMHLVCAHCLALWRQSAARDGIQLRVLAL